MRGKLQTDGRSVQAAMGVAIYRRTRALDGAFKYEPIFYSATILRDVVSAFQTEAMALDTAVFNLKRILL